MEEEKLRSHQRINDILLGPLERPALAWMARKMPAWVTPDILTGIGFFASILICVSFWLTTYDKNFLWLVSFGILLNWWGDSLDGSLARYRHIERPRYGFFIDHITDTLSEILVFVGLGLSPYVDFRIALIGLVCYLNISILVYLIMVTKGVFKISLWKIGPTEIRMIAILANIGIYFANNPKLPAPLNQYTYYDAVIAGVALLLLVFFFVEATRTGIELSAQDNYTRERREQRAVAKQDRRERKAADKQQRRARKQHRTPKKAADRLVN
ncbi:MAG: CDP-alcohol phosphatidyltransferase family protein [Bellilinea sp.]